jgi:hypothetical protein
MIVEKSWYVPNAVIRTDLETPTVKEEIRRYSSRYSARLSVQKNDPVVNFMARSDWRLLRTHLSNYLPTRYVI